jgi:GTP-binding protein
MTAVIAIVGRPNVGKSTLFNCLTKSRRALVADIPGVTRDRLYGTGEFNHQPFIVIDTGGMTQMANPIENLTLDQALQAIVEADFVLFVVDAKEGPSSDDFEIANKLRQFNKPWALVTNKNDQFSRALEQDFYALGMGEPISISSAHRRGVEDLLEAIWPKLPSPEIAAPENHVKGIRVAIVGRPNVGKSTLVNRMLGEERVIVYDQAGTTRDSVYIPFERLGQSYVLIDTAGVRRKKNVSETLEKFSIIKTLQAIEEADVVLMLLDARTNVIDQDLKLLDFILSSGKALVVSVNKWDGLSEVERSQVRSEINRRLFFTEFAETYYISALHGSNVGNLFSAIQKAHLSASKAHSTHLLTQLLQKAVMRHSPPLVNGRRIKLRYAHLGGQQPPIIVIHGNQANAVPEHYKRYLETFYQERLKLTGTPIRMEFREGKNPFEGKKNVLTRRQLEKRRRVRRGR